MKGGEIAEDGGGGRDGAMLRLAPSLLCFPPLLSRKVFKLDPAENPAKALVRFKDAKIVHGLASGQVEQDKGEDHLLVCPALRSRTEMIRDAFSHIEDGGQIQVDRKSRQGGHAACCLLFFVLVGQDALCHNCFTSLVMELVSQPYSIIPVYQGQRGFS